jgi:hypothetical protein
MTTRPVTRLLALALPLALLVPAAANAERVVTHDALGDVQAIDFSSDEDFLPAPDHLTSDVTRTGVAYGTTRLKVTVHFRDLQNAPLLRTEVRLRTPQGGYFITMTRMGGKRARMTIVRRSGRGVECRRLTGRFDGTGDTVTISIPGVCIGSPGWVQVGVAAVGTEDADLDPDALVFYVDDAHRDSVRERGITLGPKVRRG